LKKSSCSGVKRGKSSTQNGKWARGDSPTVLGIKMDADRHENETKNKKRKKD
jgi:hypothetical protein